MALTRREFTAPRAQGVRAERIPRKANAVPGRALIVRRTVEDGGERSFAGVILLNVVEESTPVRTVYVPGHVEDGDIAFQADGALEDIIFE